eukprot:6212533-Pleurochrysis_carterae.AAC.1
MHRCAPCNASTQDRSFVSREGRVNRNLLIYLLPQLLNSSNRAKDALLTPQIARAKDRGTVSNER